MRAILSRTYTRTETKGLFLVLNETDLITKCVTIELPDNGNQRKVSCIPEGKYDVVKIIRTNGDPAFHVLNVKDRDAILIHIGNYVQGKKIDSEGCILPGEYFIDSNKDGFIDVANSTVAMNKLLKVLPEKFTLFII